MARLSRHHALDLRALRLAAWLAWLALASSAATASATDLVGTWHVLVHYRDDNAHDPQQERWDDKVWVFERKGSRLRWTEYPIVVFGDSSGRFERLGTNPASRVLHSWQPNGRQLAQIQQGLEVNPRGSKSKTLRKSGDGWSSASRPAAASASVITYVENWSIEGLSALPVFRREDILGSALSESLEGVTLYATAQIEADGVLRGSFERDSTRHGTFRLLRAGPVENVKGSGKTQSERLFEMWFGDFGKAMLRGETGLQEEVARRIQAGEDVPEEVREELRREIRAAIESHMREQRVDPREHAQEVDRLTRAIEQQILEEGRSFEEIGQMLRDGSLGP